MRRVSKGWLVAIIVVTVLSIIFLMPTLLGDSLPSWWKKVFPRKGLSLGLDLRGGVHLVLGVRAQDALEHELSNLRESISDTLKEKDILYKGFQTEDKTLKVSFFSDTALAKARGSFEDYRNIVKIDESDLSLNFTLRDEYIDSVQQRAVDQVKETIGNRIDEFGVVEPTIQKTGTDRILIQVPGASAEDRKRIIGIIKRAAVLEFKIVKDTAPTQDIPLAKYGVKTLEELLQKDLQLHPGDTGNENERFFVTEKQAQVTGEYLRDARLQFDEFGRPAVGFTFGGEGATRFGKLTGENVGNRLAIVLDGIIKSAPVIQERISSQGRITGSFTTEEAKDLALVLRSGALPVPVQVEEERTVGPSLGRDSIEKGKMAMIIGGVLVVVFMVIFYKIQGIIANVALAVNMFFILGFLSAFGATLTLPGIAGLVLTIGMAVDGNIIIFERIKEELRAGKSPHAAIDGGYQKALSTVLDANITTLVTAVILFWFGTGPIKGFAVTLSLGILSTIFSNVIVARVISDLIYGERKIEALSI